LFLYDAFFQNTPPLRINEVRSYNPNGSFAQTALIGLTPLEAWGILHITNQNKFQFISLDN